MKNLQNWRLGILYQTKILELFVFFLELFMQPSCVYYYHKLDQAWEKADIEFVFTKA